MNVLRELEGFMNWKTYLNNSILVLTITGKSSLSYRVVSHGKGVLLRGTIYVLTLNIRPFIFVTKSADSSDTDLVVLFYIKFTIPHIIMTAWTPMPKVYIPKLDIKNVMQFEIFKKKIIFQNERLIFIILFFFFLILFFFIWII